MEKSYVMVKPGFANNKKVINIIEKRLEELGLKIVEARYVKYTKFEARIHYAEHLGESFYPELEKYITSDKAFGMVVEGENAITKIRNATHEIREFVPTMLGTKQRKTENVIHSSDSKYSAEREIDLFHEMPTVVEAEEELM